VCVELVDAALPVDEELRDVVCPGGAVGDRLALEQPQAPQAREVLGALGKLLLVELDGRNEVSPRHPISAQRRHDRDGSRSRREV
jgi:hypothetical protein